MANLPEKNITTVDKITSIPSNTNLYINANGEFRQASIDDVLKASPVIADSIANQYKNASGSPILLTDSSKGVAIDFNAKGKSTQIQYSGKNLANVKDRTSQTREGITSTITNKIISASGTATSGTADIVVDLDTPITIKSGTYYTLSLQKITGTMSTGFTVYLFDTVTSTYPHYYDLVNTNSITFNLASDISCSSVLIRLPMSHTINGTFRLQIEKGTTKTDYEPYTNGASPNPSYPQAIKSVGDMGYFDGELLQGQYDSTNGIHANNWMYVCNKNPIPCNAGDTIKLIYGSTARIINFVFFDENGVFLSSPSATNTTVGSVTAPTNASYFVFNVSESATIAIAPSTAKHICVTINDKYALIVDSNNDRKYIPISSPLRGIGEVTDVARLSECQVARKYTKVVFDGSSSEGWSLKTIGCELYLNNTNSGNALCTHYKKNNGVSWGDLQGNEFNIIGTVLRIKDNTHQSTLDEWKAWLQSNPITVIYELAEPTTESIEPIDVDTFEGVTHISTSDNADMEVEYPTSKVAGIASIGWSKGRRAEYDLEQLKAQMLALQTTIVSTV